MLQFPKIHRLWHVQLECNQNHNGSIYASDTNPFPKCATSDSIRNLNTSPTFLCKSCSYCHWHALRSHWLAPSIIILISTQCGNVRFLFAERLMYFPDRLWLLLLFVPNALLRLADPSRYVGEEQNQTERHAISCGIPLLHLTCSPFSWGVRSIKDMSAV